MPARHLPDPPPQQHTPSPSTSTAAPTTAIPTRYNPQPMRVSKYKPPSIIPKKRVIKPDPEEMEEEEDALMAMSDPEPSTRSVPPLEQSDQSFVQTAALHVDPEPVEPLQSDPLAQQPPVQQPNIPRFVPPVQNEAPHHVEPPTAPVSPSTLSALPAKKRVRVGLSKKTSTPLHQVNLPTPSTSSYTPPTNLHRPPATPPSSSFTKASTIANDNAEASSSSNTPSTSSVPLPSSTDRESNGESSTTKPFKSPFTEGK